MKSKKKTYPHGFPQSVDNSEDRLGISAGIMITENHPIIKLISVESNKKCFGTEKGTERVHSFGESMKDFLILYTKKSAVELWEDEGQKRPGTVHDGGKIVQKHAGRKNRKKCVVDRTNPKRRKKTGGYLVEIACMDCNLPVESV